MVDALLIAMPVSFFVFMALIIGISIFLRMKYGYTGRVRIPVGAMLVANQQAARNQAIQANRPIIYNNQGPQGQGQGPVQGGVQPGAAPPYHSPSAPPPEYPGQMQAQTPYGATKPYDPAYPPGQGPYGQPPPAYQLQAAPQAQYPPPSYPPGMQQNTPYNIDHQRNTQPANAPRARTPMPDVQ